MTFHKNIFTHILKCGLIFGFITLAFSCKNLSDASVSKKDANTKTLNIEIANYADVIEASQKSSAKRSAVEINGARTIIPTTFDSAGVKFYLYGEATNGKKFGPSVVTFTGNGGSNTVGTIAISADEYVWEFTLAALDNSATAPTTLDEMKENAVLIGYSSMDMANGNTAKFTLSPDGLKKEASVAMKLYLDSWTIPTGYTAKAGIYKLTDGSIVNDKDDNSTETTIAIANLQTAAPADANYTVTKMDPGTYLFKVTFENPTTKKKFIWSDVLIVLPGKAVENAVAIPNVIGVKPDAPTDFKAGYVKDSEDIYNGMYVTEFTWVRGVSKNENYFEIDLLELADAATVPTDDTSWDANGGIKNTYGANFSSSDIHESGSLLGGNTKAQVRLSLEKRYYARIRAVNDAGASDYVYVALDGTNAFTPSSTINRYRITYHLNNGVFTGTAGTNTLTNETNDIVLYYCQDETDGNDIIVPDGTNTTLIYTPETTSYNFTSWKTGDSKKYDNAVNVDYPKYKDYKNLDLYASYEIESGVEIFDKSAYEIQVGWISVDGGTALTEKTAAIDATASATATSTWTFTPTGITNPSGNTIDDFTYDSVIFEVSRGGRTYYAATEANVKVDVGTTFNMPLDGLASGVYNVMFTAHKGTTTVSCNITTTITR